MTPKSPKELAFLQDLYVATDWGERFAELVDTHVELPKKGRALYVAAGTGGHAMALQERAGNKVTFVCVDDSSECLDLARAKAVTMDQQTEFRLEQPASLSFSDDQFDLVLGNSSFAPHGDLARQLSELVRVAIPGGTVAWWLPTASSFGEFFSIYWEALYSSDLQDHGVDVEHMILELPTVSDVEKMAESEGLEHVTSWTAIEEFDYESGEQFLNSPLNHRFSVAGLVGSRAGIGAGPSFRGVGAHYRRGAPQRRVCFVGKGNACGWYESSNPVIVLGTAKRVESGR
jgi:ubiquinone/menaquinone biosynthesis C-methylase UbiE